MTSWLGRDFPATRLPADSSTRLQGDGRLTLIQEYAARSEGGGSTVRLGAATRLQSMAGETEQLLDVGIIVGMEVLTESGSLQKMSGGLDPTRSITCYSCSRHACLRYA